MVCSDSGMNAQRLELKKVAFKCILKFNDSTNDEYHIHEYLVGLLV